MSNIDKNLFPQKIPVSIITSDQGLLTKSLRFENGQIIKSSAGNMYSGRVKTVLISSPDGFARMLRSRQPNQAIAHGVCKFKEARIVTAANLKKQLTNRPPDAIPLIARAKEHFQYNDGPAVMMFDHDKARDNSIAEGDKALAAYRPDELLIVLSKIHPELAKAASVSTPSTSACIYDKDGNELRGEGSGSHTYLFVGHGKDIPRYLEVLGKRLVLAGYGRYEISRSGALLLRTLIDLTVGSPERLDFVAGAVCEDGLVQKLPPPTVRNGELLDTTTLPDLSSEEEAKYA